LVVQFDDPMSTSGAGSVTNPANYQLLRGASDVTSLISSINYGYNPTTRHFEATLNISGGLAPGDYQLTVRDSITDSLGRSLDGDGDGLEGGNFVRTFSRPTPSTPRGPEFTAQNVPGGSGALAIAIDSSASYVVVWNEGGIAADIYARRYNAANQPLGDAFR